MFCHAYLVPQVVFVATVSIDHTPVPRGAPRQVKKAPISMLHVANNAAICLDDRRTTDETARAVSNRRAAVSSSSPVRPAPRRAGF
jgi:hypothetical protein